MTSRLHTRTCTYCGKKYTTHNYTATCSIECRDSLKSKRILDSSKTSVCPICGKLAKLTIRAYETHVCSAACRSVVCSREWRRKHGHEVDTYGRLNSPPPEVVCQVCGKKVRGKRYGQKYCCLKCKTKSIHIRNTERKDELRKSYKFCSLCNVEIDRIPTPRQMNFRSFGQRAMDTKLHFDHIVCRIDNGQNTNDNLRPLCWMCNWIRGTMDLKFDSAIAAASKSFWSEVIPVFSAITG